MSMDMNIDWNDLPESLKIYKEQILSTKRPCIEMDLSPSDDLTLWQSKIGGDPYLPLQTQYPVNAADEPLKLIAQINFAELPKNELFPERGILQFYIDSEDDLWGLDFDNQQNQSGFKVLYFDDVSQDLSQLQQQFPTQHLDADLSPISGQYAIQFSNQDSFIGITDAAFSEKIVDIYDSEDEEASELLYDEYSDFFSTNGHRLGGYPTFTQSDPREANSEIEDYVLLLQIDTDDNDGVEIMWGDSGVGNFFIHPQDLKNRDFSKVLYNWDCY